MTFIEKEIGIDELMDLIRNESSSYSLIDVRSEPEFQLGSIPTANNLPLNQLQDALQLDANTFFQRFQFPKPDFERGIKIVFTCRSGNRSSRACRVLVDAYDTRNVYNFKGSFNLFYQRFPQLVVKV